jgi:hypothetical protein
MEAVKGVDEAGPIAATTRCCVCPFCPIDWPCCFINRKSAMHHQRVEQLKHKPEDRETRMPVDEELEWVQCVSAVYMKKVRWIRANIQAKLQVETLMAFNPDDEFRLKSTYERNVKLLMKHVAPPEGLFEMGAVAANMRYFQDAKGLLQRIKSKTLSARCMM